MPFLTVIHRYNAYVIRGIDVFIGATKSVTLDTSLLLKDFFRDNEPLIPNGNNLKLSVIHYTLSLISINDKSTMDHEQRVGLVIRGLC